jgi:hypothetical protein
VFVLCSKTCRLGGEGKIPLLINARTSPKYLAQIEIGFLFFTVDKEKKHVVCCDVNSIIQIALDLGEVNIRYRSCHCKNVYGIWPCPCFLYNINQFIHLRFMDLGNNSIHGF